MRLYFAAVMPLLLAIPALADDAGKYSAWTKNEARNRYECTYSYANNSGGMSKQQVAVYPKDNPRYGWAYFYNDQGKPWGRCATKGNPKYQANQMYWQKLNAKADGYEEYPQKNFCPAPKDGKATIPAFPDPPV